MFLPRLLSTFRLLERQSVLPADYRMHMDRLGRDVTDILDPSNISGDSWRQMYEDQERQNKKSLERLLRLEKRPFGKLNPPKQHVISFQLQRY